MLEVFATNQLYVTLLGQTFSEVEPHDIEWYKESVENYVEIEQCIAVLSDFKANCSYYYKGSFGNQFGFSVADHFTDCAFEEFIFSKIHPEDLIERHILELNYFYFLKDLPQKEHHKYTTFCRIRILDAQGNYSYATHRTIYLKNFSNGSVWLALCLYSASHSTQTASGTDAQIVNVQTGEKVMFNKYSRYKEKFLSQREIEILRLVGEGKNSNEIARQLYISVYTVRRHRQNIITKMKVSNATEAVKIGITMGIL
ncbi:response regulator transcription factor [Flavobacterium branchiicola]|uniref:Response regulator transcription factor n=1 Tax=Flavobacterium branchiicola TaxID=1114875 RepID=A0ABV9PJU5_9FLAO|nr:response regulator transcription factor [Flavobacterium branchiicola]MBS7256773.1 response regulator transcription factor [Flavobacterium branchiicola]